MSRYTPYGPGDEITWAPYYGHPNDPRDMDDGTWEDDEDEFDDSEEEETEE